MRPLRLVELVEQIEGLVDGAARQPEPVRVRWLLAASPLLRQARGRWLELCACVARREESLRRKHARLGLRIDVAARLVSGRAA